MNRRAFTLLELLVAIVIIAILTALIFSAVRSSIDAGNTAACISNLRQIGAAIATYSGDNEGKIPYGPKAPPFTSPSDLYPSTGAPTSLLSLRNGAPVGLGLLLEHYLDKTPEVLFCPGCDRKIDAKAELAKVGHTQAQGGYYYRHAGVTALFDSPSTSAEPDHIRFGNLGDNRHQKPIRALVMDTIFLCPKDLDQFNVKPHSNHDSQRANILFADGHVSSRPNTDQRFTVDVSDYSQLRGAFDKILKAFEAADEEP